MTDQATPEPSGGTEALGPLLYWLLRSIRPRRVLEIGMGETTLHLARAMRDNQQAFARERAALVAKGADHPPFGGAWSLAFPAFADPGFYLEAWQGRLLAVDADADGVIALVSELLRAEGLLPFVEIEHGPFQPKLEQFHAEERRFDLVWFDCGGYPEYAAFLDRGWDLVEPAGGLLVLHYTLTNLPLGYALRDFLLRRDGPGREVEHVSFLEPHKFMQNSYTILRRVAAFRERIYETPDVRMMTDLAQLATAPPADED